jgi:hypothetical protein
MDELMYGKMPRAPIPRKELPVKLFARPNKGFDT